MMIGGLSTLALVAVSIKLAIIIGAIIAVILGVRALRKSAREQERIVEKLDQIQRALKKEPA